MAGGFRTALFLLGLAASQAVVPPAPPPVVVAEQLSGGWRLTDEQIARLRGERPEPPRPVGESGSDPTLVREDVRQGGGLVPPPTPPPGAAIPRAVDTIAEAVHPAARADLVRRQTLARHAQAAREEEAALLLLLLTED